MVVTAVGRGKELKGMGAVWDDGTLGGRQQRQ